MTLTFSFECLQGERPDILGYLIRRDGKVWMDEIGAEIDLAQRDACDKGRKKKARNDSVKLAAHLCTVRDRMQETIKRGEF